MPKIILFIACSLDGFIADEDGRIGWLFHDQDYGYKKFYSSIGTVLIGRKTFEQALTFEESPFSDKKCIVFAREKLKKLLPHVEVESDLLPCIRNLKKTEKKDIWVVGGSEIISQLLNKGLIDEFIISVHPIAIGKGIPLFKELKKPLDLKFKKQKAFDSGLVQLHYEKIKKI
ncbi:MAG: dihydrofolate reductase [Nitrospirae bacterium]|nr:dihydrofolate reductase [Nitrospirota bacterium]